MSAPQPVPAEPISVALFPIPNMVAFPGTMVPLHVFEPRYRRLVHDCVEAQRMVGVCHTRKTIRAARQDQSLEEALSSNQATYQPYEVFSAGDCVIRETTADGRILASIQMRQRLSMREELQALPYRIVACDVVEDEPELEGADANLELQALISKRLEQLVAAANPDADNPLDQEAWSDLDPGAFSFRVFQFLRLDADLMQSVLEMRSANERLQVIWDVLRRC